MRAIHCIVDATQSNTPRAHNARGEASPLAKPMNAWVREHYGAHTAKKLQAAVNVSEATADRILCDEGTMNNWLALAQLHGWEFVHQTLEALIGPYEPALADQRTNEILASLIAIQQQLTSKPKTPLRLRIRRAFEGVLG